MDRHIRAFGQSRRNPRIDVPVHPRFLVRSTSPPRNNSPHEITVPVAPRVNGAGKLCELMERGMPQKVGPDPSRKRMQTPWH